MPMSFARFVVAETIAVTALNAGMNAGYTSWLWRRPMPLPLDAIATDLAATPVFIAVLSTLLGTAATRRKLSGGRVAAPAALSGERWLVRLPVGILARSALLGILSAVLLTVPLLAVLGGADIATLPLAAAVGAKVAITVLFSLLIVPLGILAATVDGRRLPAGAASAAATVPIRPRTA